MARFLNENLDKIDEIIDCNIYIDESLSATKTICCCVAVYITNKNSEVLYKLHSNFKQKLIKYDLLNEKSELKWSNIKKKILYNKEKTRRFKILFYRFFNKANSLFKFDYLHISNYHNAPHTFNVIKLFILQRLSEKKDFSSKIYKINFDDQYLYTASLFKQFNKDYRNDSKNKDRYIAAIKKDDLIVISKYKTKYTHSKDRLFQSLDGISKRKVKNFYFYTFPEFVKNLNEFTNDSEKYFFYCQDIDSRHSIGLSIADIFVGIFRESIDGSKYMSIYNNIEKQISGFSIFRISDGN